MRGDETHRPLDDASCGRQSLTSAATAERLGATRPAGLKHPTLRDERGAC